jgi:ClpX C4-type zinc finger
MPRPAVRKPATKKTADGQCSFCRRGTVEVARLVDGPGVSICDDCVKTCNSILRGKKAAAFPACASIGDDELLAGLAPAGRCIRSLETSVRDQVAELRNRNVSWERIGSALGVTRQAAQQRFSS